MKIECSKLDILLFADSENNNLENHINLPQLKKSYVKTLSSITKWSDIISPKCVSIFGNQSLSHLDLQELVSSCSQHWSESDLRLIIDVTQISDKSALPELFEETGCTLEIRTNGNASLTDRIKHIIQRWQRVYYFNVVFSDTCYEKQNSNIFIRQLTRSPERDQTLNVKKNLDNSHLMIRNGDVYYACLDKTKISQKSRNEFPTGNDDHVNIPIQKPAHFHNKPIRNEKIKLGFCIPTMSMGGVTRSLLTMMNVSCTHNFEWSGFAIGSPIAFDPETAKLILEHCPIYSSMDHPDFKGLVTITGNACQRIVDQSDIVKLWGYIAPNRELERTSWKNKPLLIVAHGQNEWTRKNIQTSLRYSKQSVLVSVSRNGIQTFPEHLRKDVNVIYNGIDFRRCTPLINREEIRNSWGICSDTFAIGYIGRFAQGKNVYAAAEAVSVLGKNYHAVYVGEGIENSHVINRVKELCGKRCSFMPRTEDIGSVYSGLDCLISASPSEGGPLSVSEAWVARCPVVSTPVGFIPELQKTYGQLVIRLPLDPTPEEIAHEVTKVNKSGPIVERAKKIARLEFNPSRMIKKYESLITNKLRDGENQMHYKKEHSSDDIQTSLGNV